jgi:hypothetical protein
LEKKRNACTLLVENLKGKNFLRDCGMGGRRVKLMLHE